MPFPTACNIVTAFNTVKFCQFLTVNWSKHFYSVVFLPCMKWQHVLAHALNCGSQSHIKLVPSRPFFVKGSEKQGWCIKLSVTSGLENSLCDNTPWKARGSAQRVLAQSPQKPEVSTGRVTRSVSRGELLSLSLPLSLSLSLSQFRTNARRPQQRSLFLPEESEM